MRRLSWLAAVTSLVLASPIVMVTPLAAAAGEPASTFLVVESVRKFADRPTTIDVTLLERATGAPVAHAVVRLERVVDEVSSPVAQATTDEAGHATFEQTLSRDIDDNDFTAYFDGDEVHAPTYSGARAVIKRRHGDITVSGPAQVQDGQPVPLRIRWQTGNGLPVDGRFQLRRRDRGGYWKTYGWFQTDESGRVTLEVQPHIDTRWRAATPVLEWVRTDVSPVHRIDHQSH